MTTWFIHAKRLLDPDVPHAAPSIAGLLRDVEVVIGDVGATGTPPDRFFSIFKHCKFLAFDPDPRAEKFNTSNVEHIPKALWSTTATQSLYLTAFPPASSIFKPNAKLAKDFISIAENARVVGEESVAVTTLDSLSDLPKIDFLKVDVEGAELEVLKGGVDKLSQCLGLEVELQYVERNIGSPMFGDVNQFLLERGYYLQNIENMGWIRDSKFSHATRPQATWADATYLMHPDTFTAMLEDAAEGDRKTLVTKYIVVMGLCGAHDALESLLADERLLRFDIDRDGARKIFHYLRGRHWITEAALRLTVSFVALITSIVLVFLPKLSRRLRILSKRNAGAFGFLVARMTSGDIETGTFRVF